ncbi:uncharacterized protein LOC105634627 [Jatropha curcas]|uniref:uncharacterized protein LOC105634627 n=1 Tax=Jatropha curcas TaxID=180498 RepID=UPI0005FBB4CA|nr:uncharacterized protein LOC105634627 [Jatropha curcas]
MKTPEGRSLALENLSEFIQTFQTKKFCELPQLEIEKALALVHDFRTAGLEVDWLQPRLKDMLEAKQLIKQSSTLKERRDKSNQVIKEKKEELEVYEPQLLALQEKVNLAKKKLASAQAEAETIREKVSNAKAKVRFFVDHSPLDGLL